MAKPEREDCVRRGEQLLAQWGVGAQADAGELRAHAHRDPAADLALAARLGAQPADSSVALLLEIDARTADKLVHKEVKRALYRLEQRGISRPAQPGTTAPVPALAPQIEGYLSAIDGRGDQLVWLVRQLPSGVAHFLAMINDPAGLREVALNQVTRRAVRELRQELEDKHEIRMVETEWRYCDFLIHRAFGWAQQRGTPVVADYPGLRNQIVKLPAATDLPPLIFSHLEAAAIRADAALLADSPALFEEKELRTWFFEEEALKPYLEALAAANDSPLVLSPSQQKDRFRVAMEQAVEELFGGHWQESWCRRLYTMAYYFAATRRELAAQRACAVALALVDSAHGGRGIAFCEQLVRASVAFLFQAAAEQEQARAETSLIVTPQQAAAEAAQRRPR
ncbi:MAG: hypothetical protein HY699_07325 [Deltaproteobacteria bacterium]|nr:hypothetical protein [Deltaproteobacteria bacterium]